MIFVIGLSLIVLGWIVQLYRTVIKKDRGLNLVLLILYAVGCACLSVGGFLDKDMATGILNAILVILPAAIIISLLVRKKAT